VGRATQGVRLVRLEDEQTVVCFDHVPLEGQENTSAPKAGVPDSGDDD
jgi:DNA gyrase subunit A